MAKRPLTAVFAALMQMGYRSESTESSIVVWFKVEANIEPSYAIFDASQPTIDDQQLVRTLQVAGIDCDAFLALLEGIDPST